MSALTAYRNTSKLEDGPIPQLLTFPVAASVNIHQGSLVSIDTSGNARPARANITDVVVGRSETVESNVSGTGANNSSGSAGAVSVSIRQGCFKWANSSAGDAIAAANIGQLCYAVDDQTVALTDGDGARPPAGVVVRVDSDGVYVATFFGSAAQGASATAAPAGGFSTLTTYMPLAGIANGDMVAAYAPGFSGKILSIQAIVVTAATTAAKAATLTPQITPNGGAETPVTGGALALTSANCTPVNKVVAGAAITGANVFGNLDTISIKASAVTAFVEGAVMVCLTIQALP